MIKKKHLIIATICSSLVLVPIVSNAFFGFGFTLPYFVTDYIALAKNKILANEKIQEFITQSQKYALLIDKTSQLLGINNDFTKNVAQYSTDISKLYTFPEKDILLTDAGHYNLYTQEGYDEYVLHLENLYQTGLSETLVIMKDTSDNIKIKEAYMYDVMDAKADIKNNAVGSKVAEQQRSNAISGIQGMIDIDKGKAKIAIKMNDITRDQTSLTEESVARAKGSIIRSLNATDPFKREAEQEKKGEKKESFGWGNFDI